MGTNVFAKLFVTVATRRKHDEKQQPPRNGALLESGCIDHQRFNDLRYFFYHAVELGGSHADTTTIQGRVGAPIDHALPVAGRDLDPIAMPPDTGIMLEIARPHPASIRIIPETNRHARHRRGED